MSAAPPTTARPSAAGGDAEAGARGRRGAVRRGRRLEVRRSPRALRPSRRSSAAQALGLFANLRPAILYPELAAASTLKPEVVAGPRHPDRARADRRHLLRQPRGRRSAPDGAFAGQREAFDTMRYARPEIERIARVAFEAARKRSARL
jgi:3-isopropylmalate dehydrogenase